MTITEEEQIQLIKARVCVKCKHIATNASHDWERYKCMHPKNFSHINPVTGDNVYRLPLCKDMRGKNVDAICGTDGTLWEEHIEQPEIPLWTATDISNIGNIAQERIAGLKKKKLGNLDDLKL